MAQPKTADGRGFEFGTVNSEFGIAARLRLKASPRQAHPSVATNPDVIPSEGA
jgi:hypothetical protein